ncbi:MBL fold metallo-hydrolase [bacterium]|jgi:glyoxylase-like metal-dependent hydrolase (beta-lactamase superfamily II)|nr:MBL fold metallo-hydrolase [bacterium]
MIKIIKIVNGPLETNCYLIFCADTRRTVILDPFDYMYVEEIIAKNGLEPEIIVNTHFHADHTAGNGALKRRFNIPIAIHEDDAELLVSGYKILEIYGIKTEASPPADILLSEGKKIVFGGESMDVIHTPGHSPGSICLYYPEKILFSGDTLFASGVGRTDLPGGDTESLSLSVKTKIFALPGSVTVYPGHGGDTSIKTEKKYGTDIL